MEVVIGTLKVVFPEKALMMPVMHSKVRPYAFKISHLLINVIEGFICAFIANVDYVSGELIQELGKFDLEDLPRASAEVMGKGTFGTAYKAVLEMGFAVAVKRLKDVTMADKEFREKIVEGVGAMDHENLVRLSAYYCNEKKSLLCKDHSF